YVFACIKVTEVSTEGAPELHPLRFTFTVSQKQGIYFPMKLTGLQDEWFNLNLYIFHPYQLDHSRTEKGYTHYGFLREYSDWDTPGCEHNAGKKYWLPRSDPFLEPKAYLIPNVTSLFTKLHKGERYHLTQISGKFNPRKIRQ